MEFSGVFRSLVDVNGILILVEFSRIPGLVEFSGFLRYRVDGRGNFGLVDCGRFFRF